MLMLWIVLLFDGFIMNKRKVLRFNLRNLSSQLTFVSYVECDLEWLMVIFQNQRNAFFSISYSCGAMSNSVSAKKFISVSKFENRPIYYIGQAQGPFTKQFDIDRSKVKITKQHTGF